MKIASKRTKGRKSNVASTFGLSSWVFRLCLLFCLSSFVFLTACKAHRQYPDLSPGWHNADYSKVFGRIQRLPQADPTAKPVWIVRYGYGESDPYSGKLNLYPDAALAGYSGGELVELKGAVSKDYTLPNFTGTWYKVDEIRMWSNQSAR